MMKRFSITFLSILFIFIPLAGVHAASDSAVVNFSVEQNFDISGRSQVPAELVKTTQSIYFYIEKGWWDVQLPARQAEILNELNNLSNEFDGKIYPTLTSVFGSEWRPGVDGDTRITVFFHAMQENATGYFRSSDEYIKLQVPDSNEREMVYMSLDQIDSPLLKMFLGHEFVHLITFNQKDRMQGVQEDTWLNEARADYASTILGYDDLYDGSNLQKRVKNFLEKPSDPLTEWQENKYDYAVVNIFMHYLVDHYGINILTDSLKSKLVGIPSIDAALVKNGAKENFAKIFTNWTIATILNDCSLGLKYCYLNKNLTNLRINPIINFLPLSGNSSLSVTNVTKNWSGNWQKIIGGNGNLKLQFESSAGLNFQIPYLVFDKDNKYTLNFLKLDKSQKGEIDINDFGSQYTSLIIIPSLQSKITGFDGLEPTYPYTFTVSITGAVPQEDPVLIQKLLAQIDSLKKQIAAIQNGNPQSNGDISCTSLTNNLYFGLQANGEVTCLQQFLKAQGQDIYPEGLVTGYFGALTKAAVVRFQRMYDIAQTGFVGVITRTKINQLLNGN